MSIVEDSKQLLVYEAKFQAIQLIGCFFNLSTLKNARMIKFLNERIYYILAFTHFYILDLHKAQKAKDLKFS